MLRSFRTRRTSVFIWLLMGALIVGLAGFGIGAGRGLTSNSVARVGDQTVDANDYVRALQQELRALTQQLGRDVPISEARQYGVDRMVLGRLVNDAALDDEAKRLGLSASDQTIHDEVVASQAFQGPDGKFSRDAYTFALDRIGLRPAEFEAMLRREAGRDLVASAVQAPATLPDSAADTVLAFLGEKRTFDWIRLDPALLPEPIAAPTDAEIQSEYDANPDRYTRPETRHITYAAVTPESLAASIEFPDDELRAAYEADIARYQTPERRVLDRIAFATDADAEAAKKRLDSGEITFDALATERGLQPGDIDQGFVTADQLSPEARAAVFGAAGPGIVGPVPTSLGPSIYRINAVLGATTTSFEDAKDGIAKVKALEEAKRQIAEDTTHIEDLLAGGATAEEIASETVMELGTIDLNSETTGGLADDSAFRTAAGDARTGEETDLVELANGGLATIRVDSIDPPALIPLDQVRDRVAADWTSGQTSAALTELADGYATELHGGLAFEALAQRIGRPMQVGGPLTRGETATGAPPELVADIFGADVDGTVVRRDGEAVILAQLRSVEPFDPATPETAPVVDQLRSQYTSQAADDVLALYTAALREELGVRVNQSLVDSTLARFQ
jgi:peptidyl-prolyl cis-trans isomerase D